MDTHQRGCLNADNAMETVIRFQNEVPTRYGFHPSLGDSFAMTAPSTDSFDIPILSNREDVFYNTCAIVDND